MAARTIFLPLLLASSCLVPILCFAPLKVAGLSRRFLKQPVRTRTQLALSNDSSSTKPKRKRLYSFIEARRVARGHGFTSKQEFIEYECAGAYQLPKNADEVWRDDWKGWNDFLGVRWNFEEGKEIARKLKLQSEEEYLEFSREKKANEDDPASRLPFRPDLLYKEEWQGWDAWLGK